MHNSMKLLLAVSLASLGVSGAARVTGDPVQVTGGLIEGEWSANADVRTYFGIPFAAPPIGSNRWKEPQPVIPWSGVRKANTLPPMCMQGSRAPGSVSIEAYGRNDLPMSEDCLYLNVWTPANIPTGKSLPVLFWIHGGGNTSGTGSKPEFNGNVLAQKGLIVVTINYRVGLFGFFAHPALTAESPHKSSGNYGLLDHVAALRWVKDNIAAFGGDPARVTIAGQSVGGGAVNNLMVSPLAKGLFSRASAQSSGSGPGRMRSLAEGEANGLRFAAMIGNQSLEQLRAMRADTLLSIFVDTRTPAGAVIDGYYFTRDPAEVWRDGQEAPVPYMPGWSSHEFMEQTYDRTLAEFRKLATERVGKSNVPTMLKLYGVNDDATATTARVAFSRDGGFGLGAWRNARSHAAKAPTYVYYWSPEIPYWPGQSYAENSPATLLGAYHGSQVPYLFGNLQLLDRPFRQVDRDLSSNWQSYLINFARTGDPNGPGLPTWGRFTESSQVALIMAETTATAPIPNRDKMEFFEKVTAPGAPRPARNANMISGR